MLHKLSLVTEFIDTTEEGRSVPKVCWMWWQSAVWHTIVSVTPIRLSVTVCRRVPSKEVPYLAL